MPSATGIARGLGLAGLVLVGPLGCSASRPERVLRIAHEADALSFDPTVYPEAATSSILSNFYESLVAYDTEQGLVPALAESWVSLDDRTWLFRLRHDVRFHDGTLLTPRDVKSSLERARTDPASGVKGYLATLDSVETNATGVTIHTSRPDPLLLNRLVYVFIVPGSLAARGFDRPVGTGPYRLTRWQKGSSLETEAFRDYWKGPPAIKRVVFIRVDSHQVVDTLRAGGADVLRWVPEMAVDEVALLKDVRVVTREGLSAFYVWMDSRRSESAHRNPFADRRVRQALSLAIDRDRLKADLHGRVVPLRQLVHQGVFGHAMELPELSFDPQQARRMLAEAGYPAGFEVTLAHRDQASLTIVVQSLRRMLGEVGIRLKPRAVPWEEMLRETWIARRIPFFLGGWQFDEVDAWGFFRDCLYTRDETRTRGAYNPGYSNPELDRLIDRVDLVFDRRERLAQYKTIARLALEDMPMVPLYVPEDNYAVSTRVQWRPRLDGTLLAAEMSWRPDR